MSEPIADTASSAAASYSLSPLELFLHADIIVKAVVLILILASLWSWVVIADKLIRLWVLNRRANRLIEGVQAKMSVSTLAPEFASAPGDDPLVVTYKAMLAEYQQSSDFLQTEAQRESLQDRVHRVGQLATSHGLEVLQSRLAGLATIGSVSPFVGLFGTVWGIMNSFQGIAASNNTSLSAVAPGIAEALFATALGLVAAIPAVVFYNRIGGKIDKYRRRLLNFIGVFEIELSRQLAKKGDRSGLRVA